MIMLIKGVKSESEKKMPGCGVDNRLRRQTPVHLRQRVPRLRLGPRVASSSNKDHAENPRHEKTKSWHGSGSASCMNLTDFGIEDLSKFDNITSNENKNGSNCSDTSVNRPLIHHQRYNLKNRFHLMKTLGEGTYGKVKLAADCSTGEHVAIKYIKKTKIHDEADLTRIRREIQILSSLKHNHIVNIREVFEKKDKIVLVMDYAQGGELYDYLNKSARLSETEARRIFRQIVAAIHYCHQNGIVHRDLKLENIILDDAGNVKIADFGLANYFSYDKTLETFCGSPLYASPEIVNGKFYHGPEVDVWSLGVVLYTLVYGAMPFESNSLVSLKEQISRGSYAQPSQPSDAAGLIRHMLTVTPSRRATTEDALCHWWLNFGHSQMPNGAPYNPDYQSRSRRSKNSSTVPHIGPFHSPSLSAPVTSSATGPVISITCIHQRNQSSISSDSDLELDFKPSRWSKFNALDKNSCCSSQSPSIDGNSSSSSSSFACSNFTEDSSILTTDVLSPVSPKNGEVSGAMLEILKDCSSKTLACLLGTHNISSGFDLQQQSISSVSTNSLPEKTDMEKVNTSVFDSERKPKRGILKRKGKFSGGDSGCIMPEEMSIRHDERSVPKSGNLPKRLPSFRGEAHGIFASKHRISQLIPGENQPENHNASAMSLSEWASSDICDQTPSPSDQQLSSSSHDRQPENTRLIQQEQLCSKPLYEMNSLNATISQSPIPSGLEDTNNSSSTPLPTVPTVSCHTQPTNLLTTSSVSAPCLNLLGDQCPEFALSPAGLTPYSYSVQGDSLSTCSATVATKVTRRPKSILKASKTSQLEEARNRLSVSSIGSNSSADFLDLSYDSGDSDHFVNLRHLSSPDDNLTSETSPPDSFYGGDRASLCLDEDFDSLKGVSPEEAPSQNQLLESRHDLEVVTMEKVEVQLIPTTTTQAMFSEVESPMLYRLTREAKELTLH